MPDDIMLPEVIPEASNEVLSDYSTQLTDITIYLSNIQEQNKEMIFWQQSTSYASIMVFVAVGVLIISNAIKGAIKR